MQGQSRDLVGSTRKETATDKNLVSKLRKMDTVIKYPAASGHQNGRGDRTNGKRK